MTRSTQAWQAADAAHFLHPFTDHQGLARKGARIITRADNIYLWDSDGHKLLDAMSGLWCVNVGYGQQALVDAAARQMRELPFYNAFFQTATPPAIELAELLAEVTPPQFQHVFFSGSGSEGNDTIVRMVRRYWDILGQPSRQIIISRRNAYHGSSMGSGRAAWGPARNDSALFSESAAETFPARRAREQCEKWLVPVFTFVLVLFAVILVALSVGLVIPIFLGVPALVAVLGTHGMRDRLRTFGLLKKEIEPREVG